MIEIKTKFHCCGCHACEDVCPVQCIRMEEDEEGFRYPVVDKHACVQCRKCEAVCPVLHSTEVRIDATQEAFAAKHQDHATVMASSSGGIFSALAEEWISAGGVVFGAEMTDELTVRHRMVDSPEALYRLLGSKYLQSSMQDIYAQIKEKQKNGDPVLFVGTPCQNAALRSSLKNEETNLLLVDFICHGVPSQKVWRKYIGEKEAQRKYAVEHVSFRNKKLGWQKFSTEIRYANGLLENVEHREDVFMKAFLNDFALRPSCYRCKFKGNSRPSDLTIADCWGIQNFCPDFPFKDGASLVLINTEKGHRAWERIQDQCQWRQVERIEALLCNSAALESVAMPRKRKQFFKNLQSMPLEALLWQLTKKNRVQSFLERLQQRIHAVQLRRRWKP